MTAFDRAVDLVLQLEGGYVNDPRDPGGETKYGISKRSYPDVDIAALTREDAIAIYHRDFWMPVASVVADPQMRMLVFDSAVNHGLSRALEWYDEHPTINDFLAHRVFFYTELTRLWPTYGRGWMRRVAHVIERLAEFDQGPGQETAAVDGHMVIRMVDRRDLLPRLLSALVGQSGPLRFTVVENGEGEGPELILQHQDA